MRAVVISRPGGPEVLEFRDVPAPQPAAGEVLVKVHAFGLNRADLLQRRGLYPAPPGAPADIPGLEFAGEVVALGADVSRGGSRSGGGAGSRSDVGAGSSQRGTTDDAGATRGSGNVEESGSAADAARSKASAAALVDRRKALRARSSLPPVTPDKHTPRISNRVMGICSGGSYAEYITVPSGQIIPIPDRMSYGVAGAIPEAFLTAHDALSQLQVAGEEWVLVHAVGSGVGTAAIQLVKAMGSRCIGTSRTPDKLVRARELGLDVGLEAGAADLVDQVRAASGGGVDAVVDLVAGSGFGQTLKCMALCGRLIIVGLTGGSKTELDMGLVLRQRLTIMGTVLRSRTAEEKSEVTQSFIANALPFFSDGRVRAVVDREFAFEEIGRAHEYMESNANFGKVVVLVR